MKTSFVRRRDFFRVETDDIPGVPRGTVVCPQCEDAGIDTKQHVCVSIFVGYPNAMGRALHRWAAANGFLKGGATWTYPPEGAAFEAWAAKRREVAGAIHGRVAHESWRRFS